MTELETVIENSPRLQPTTKRNYLRAVRLFLKFAGTHPSNWTGVAVENWRDSLNQQLKSQSVNVHMAALRYASRRLAQRHHNPQLDFANYAEMLKAGQAKAPRVLSHEEGARLVEACRGINPTDLRDYAIAVLGLRTGLRREGLCAITFRDFDDTGRVQVTLKGGRRHWILLDAEVMEALSPWVNWLVESGVQTGRIFRSVSKPMLDGTVRVRKELSPSGLYHAMKERADKASIKGFHPHVFRHSFVSWCQEAGIPAYRIAGITGHKSTGMLDTYTTDLDTQPVGSLLPTLRRGR